MVKLLVRIVRVILLDGRVYREVKQDKQALSEAALISIIYGALFSRYLTDKIAMPAALALGVLSALIGWYILAYFIFIVGTKLLPEKGKSASFAEVLRAIGFVNAAGLLLLAGFISPFKMDALRFSEIWMLASTIIAVRGAFNYSSTWRAIGVYLVILFIRLIALRFLILLMGGPGNLSLPANIL